MKAWIRRCATLLFALCLLLLPSCQWFRSAPAIKEGTLVVTFLDVGQGDAILLQTSEGAILVDAGTERAEEELIYELRTLGVSSLSLFVMTHPDFDHIGGADGVIDAFPIDEVWCPESSSDGGAVSRVAEALESAGLAAIPVAKGKSYLLGDLELRVLSPATPSKNDNASSIVLKASFGQIDLLFMSDADEKVESALLKEYPEKTLDCEILKAGHHGSKTASSAAFLEVATPEYTIISCGAGNSYGHPHGEVLERLEAVGSTILRTDLSGSIRIETDGTSLKIKQ